jgi:hypothetical protein
MKHLGGTVITKVQLLFILSSIWLASSAKDKTFAFGIGVFYLLMATIIGLLGLGK